MADFKRSSRVAELLRKEVSRIINYDLKDPGVCMATVSSVDLTNDLKYARVFVSVLGDEKAKKAALQGLGRARSFIRSEVGKRTDLRFVPELSFLLDDSVDYAIGIEALIKRTKE